MCDKTHLREDEQERSSDSTESFSYDYDPSATHMQAIECGDPYDGIPGQLMIEDREEYVQPWSGFSPEPMLPDSPPIHKINIKAHDDYKGIEVHTNRWVDLACQEATQSVRRGGGPFGAVLVQVDRDGTVLRYWRNHNHVTQWNDPTAHAEIMAIRSACKQLGVFDLGCIRKSESKLPQNSEESYCHIYCSCEPCPMCYAAIVWAGIETIVFAATRYDAACDGVAFSDEAIYRSMRDAYRHRPITIRQATSKYSLDAFNLWKRSPKTPY